MGYPIGEVYAQSDRPLFTRFTVGWETCRIRRLFPRVRDSGDSSRRVAQRGVSRSQPEMGNNGKDGPEI